MAKIRSVDFSMHSDNEIEAFFDSIDDVQAERIAAAVAKREDRIAEAKQAALRKELEEVAARHGVALADALRGTGAKVAPKYRNPVTGETWTGRGRSPQWVIDWEIAHNHTRDGILIDKEEIEAA